MELFAGAVGKGKALVNNPKLIFEKNRPISSWGLNLGPFGALVGPSYFSVIYV